MVVEGDAGWLERLVLNLVDNAVKFTPEGGRVAVRVARDGDHARIEVEDTGMGLSPEDAQRVFERFFRADASRSSATEGAGLGLSLVQWIAEQHDGGVSVRSRPGEGSTFTVTLPSLSRFNPAFTAIRRMVKSYRDGCLAGDNLGRISAGWRRDSRQETLVNIEKRMAGDVMVLSLVGDMTLDGSGATMIADKVRSEMVQGQNRFVLDLGHVRYIDSAGLGELIHAFAAVRNRGGALKL